MSRNFLEACPFVLGCAICWQMFIAFSYRFFFLYFGDICYCFFFHYVLLIWDLHIFFLSSYMYIYIYIYISSSNSVTQLCPPLCNPMNCSTSVLPIHHQLLDSTQTHAHWVGDAIQPSHPLLSPSPPALNLSQHEGLFRWVSSFHQVAKILEFQLQHQSFQWTPRTDLL